MGKSHQRKKKRKNTSKRQKQEPGPRPFSDFGKVANGLLTKGYSQDQRLSISTRSCNGVILSSTAAKHGRRSSPTTQIAASYKYGNASIDVNIDAKPSFSTTLTLGGKVLPSTYTKASLKFPDYNFSKLNLKFQHFFRNAALYISVGLNQSPVVMLSASIGTASIAFGMEAKYKHASHSFTQCDAGISVTQPSCDASIILAERGDLLRLAYVHHFGHSRKISAVAEVTRRLSKNKNTFAVGGSCIVDHLTAVKAKLNNQGKLQALLHHMISPNSWLTLSGEFDTKALDKRPRIGLALALRL
ncbi:mitochondrial outer membrane protein porin 5-like [Herrania umbratica]|uniref:Mitochondrial outer membrane protein porin 5-like n=1 Tax=Herrania umbratica TaxID=108875 RepID=A0A6J1ABX9_9ROSI|nr:mitochondrial outer membrane protein porin 5-like [Herrania umbratica]